MQLKHLILFSVLFTPNSTINLDRIQQNEFKGFEYINPLIMTDEIPV